MPHNQDVIISIFYLSSKCICLNEFLEQYRSIDSNLSFSQTLVYIVIVNITMKMKKYNIKTNPKQWLEILTALHNEVLFTEKDHIFMGQESFTEFVPVHFYEEVLQLVMIRPRKVLLLWAYPRYIIDDYNFCPDQRILTHRLIGKPALGLSPPCNKLKFATTPVLHSVGLN